MAYTKEQRLVNSMSGSTKQQRQTPKEAVSNVYVLPNVSGAAGAERVNAKYNAICYQGEVDNGNSGATATINWKAGNKQTITLTANTTLTFTEPRGACNLMFRVVQDGTGSRTITWPASVKWPSATAPTLSTGASDVDIIAFYYNGTNYYGVSSLDFG